MRLFIPGAPVGKGRPRFAKRGAHVVAYTPQKTAEYERLIKTLYNEKYGKPEFAEDDALSVEITAYTPIPTSFSKAKKRDAAAAIIRPTKKPDIDNILKAVMDALNGLAYADDKQIVAVKAIKIYSAHPGVDIKIEKI